MANQVPKIYDRQESGPTENKPNKAPDGAADRPDAKQVEPVYTLDYLFDLLCGARRLARDHRFDFIAYLIEMSIIEVDNERKKSD